MSNQGGAVIKRSRGRWGDWDGGGKGQTWWMWRERGRWQQWVGVEWLKVFACKAKKCHTEFAGALVEGAAFPDVAVAQ